MSIKNTRCLSRRLSGVNVGSSRTRVFLVVLSVAIILGLGGAILYANEGYGWPTREEFKSELLTIEESQPGFVHELLTLHDSGDWWQRVNAAFETVDWGAWPWKGGAFDRQFNAPSWVVFFDTYEPLTLICMCVLGFAACWAYRTRAEPEAPTPAQAFT